MTPYRILPLLLAAALLLPSAAHARKKAKKYDKQQVAVEQAAPAAATPTPVAVTNPADQLYGEWEMLTLRKKRIFTDARPYVYLDFRAKRFYGCNGCNNINGDFRADTTHITFSNITATEGACHGATRERDVMKALAEVHAYRLSRLYQTEYLTLLGNKGQQLFTLRRHNLDFLNGAWQVKELNGKIITADNVRLVIDADQLTIHGNTGCNIINGVIHIDPDKEFAIQFEDLHSQGTPCSRIEMETALLIALEQTENAKRINAGEVALLDKYGTIVLVLTHIDLR